MSMKNWKFLAAVGMSAIAAVLMADGVAFASAIQFDFGTKRGAYSGTDAPAALGTSQSTWQTEGSIGGGNGSFNVTSGLVYADGTQATGVSITSGYSANHANTWTWGSGVTASGGTYTPVIGSTSLMGDSISTGDNNDLGVKVKGLVAGTYDVYALIDSDAQNRSYQVSIGVNNTDVTSGSQGLQESSTVTTWAAGVNYVVKRVTISSTSDYISVLVDSNSGSNQTEWACLNGLQIVQVVPEPSTLALLAGGLLGLIAYAWRKRKN